MLNHSKEHCLIGIKGNPKNNRNVDCDVLVSEVRETSRKPNEIYELIERKKQEEGNWNCLRGHIIEEKGGFRLGISCRDLFL